MQARKHIAAAAQLRLRRHTYSHRDRSPCLSPSMDLKSFTMAMPRPAVEYSTVSTTTSRVSVPNRACANPQGKIDAQPSSFGQASSSLAVL